MLLISLLFAADGPAGDIEPGDAMVEYVAATKGVGSNADVSGVTVDAGAWSREYSDGGRSRRAVGTWARRIDWICSTCKRVRTQSTQICLRADERFDPGDDRKLRGEL